MLGAILMTRRNAGSTMSYTRFDVQTSRPWFPLEFPLIWYMFQPTDFRNSSVQTTVSPTALRTGRWESRSTKADSERSARRPTTVWFSATTQGPNDHYYYTIQRERMHKRDAKRQRLMEQADVEVELLTESWTLYKLWNITICTHLHKMWNPNLEGYSWKHTKIQHFSPTFSLVETVFDRKTVKSSDPNIP